MEVKKVWTKVAGGQRILGWHCSSC